MSKFKFHGNGYRQTRLGAVTIWDVEHVESGKHLGLVAKGEQGWSAFVRGAEETGYPTRNAASERLLLVAGVNPVSWHALPADPFEGVSA